MKSLHDFFQYMTLTIDITCGFTHDPDNNSEAQT